MYPILSVLRRAATSYVFVRAEQLEQRDGRYWLRLNKPSSFLEMTARNVAWGPIVDRIPMFLLQEDALSSEEAAIRLAIKENEMAKKVRAEDQLYSVVLGPEDEILLDGKVRRRSRITVIRGVYRASAPTLEAVPPKHVAKATYQKLPPGTTFHR